LAIFYLKPIGQCRHWNITIARRAAVQPAVKRGQIEPWFIHLNPGDIQGFAQAAHGAPRHRQQDSISVQPRCICADLADIEIMYFQHRPAAKSPSSRAAAGEFQLQAGADLAQQQRIYAEIQKILWDEKPFIFLWYQTQALGVHNRVRGFAVQPNEDMMFENVTLVD